MSQMIRYCIGFAAAGILTFAAYVLVAGNILSGAVLVAAIIILALLQLIAQLVCFLHLGEVSSPKYRLFAFAGMIIILGIIVIGSLWIMNNLDYNMMHRSDGYLMQQRNKGF